MSAPDQDPRALLRLLVDGSLPENEKARLAQALWEDAALRREYVRQMRLDSLLRFRGGAAMPKSAAPEAPLVEHKPQLWRARWLAAAAVVVVAGAAAWWSWSQRGVVADVLQASGPAADVWKPGHQVRLRAWELTDGRARVRLPSGVILDAVAPLRMQFLNAMHVRLAQGRVTVEVGPAGKGFIVDTDQAKVVDQGTKFGVDVTEAGSTDVIVFKGEVELLDRPPRKDPSTVIARLVEGEAARVDAQARISRIVNVASVGGGDDWSTRGGLQAAVIAAVHDNLRDPAAKNYYGIVAGGMREDVQAYVDREHEWNGIDASGLPAFLVGADLVRTFNDDKRQEYLEVTVVLARPATLFVFAAQDQEIPAWLPAAGFVDTGQCIGLDSGPMPRRPLTTEKGPGRSIDRIFSVWKRAVPQAGEVRLGPPCIFPTWGKSMYGIAAQPLAPSEAASAGHR